MSAASLDEEGRRSTADGRNKGEDDQAQHQEKLPSPSSRAMLLRNETASGQVIGW